jgi:hypothetical protein
MMRLKGRTPAIRYLKDQIEEAKKYISMIEGLETGYYEGVIPCNSYSKGVRNDGDVKVLCLFSKLNKQSVRVELLALTKLCEGTSHEFRNLIKNQIDSAYTISFEDFFHFNKKCVKLEEVPLYIGWDYVSPLFKRIFLKGDLK